MNRTPWRRSPKEVPRWRATLRSVLATALVSLALTPLTAGVAAAQTSVLGGVVLRPTSGAYFGSWVQPRDGESTKDALLRVESQIGRTLAVDHQYYRWDDPIPTAHQSWDVAAGRIPYIAWNAKRNNGTAVSWSQIASGAEDAWITTRADALKAFGSPIYLTFHHEPEDDVPALGTATDFTAAWRHIVDVFRARGVTNVTMVWTLMSWTFTQGRADTYYPGDTYVDVVGTDGYNWNPGKPKTNWRSFDWVMAPTRSFAVAHGKPVIVAEYGVQEDPAVAGRKAQWFRDALVTLRQWPEVIAITYYDSPIIYQWWTDTTPSSLQAYAEIGRDPYLSPMGDGGGGDGGGGDGGTPPPSSPEFSDGFSSGLEGWHVTNVSLDGSQYAPGGTAPSVRASTNAAPAYAYRDLAATADALCASLAVNVSSAGSASFSLLKVRAADNGSIARIYREPDGRLRVRNDVASKVMNTGRSLPTGWSTIGLCVDVTADLLSVSLNGASIGSWTTDLGSVPVGRVQILDEQAKTFAANVDDVEAYLPSS